MSVEPTRAELEAADCWFTTDRVSRQPQVTAYKRQARLHQARWREVQGLPQGSHWSGNPRVERPNGSRIKAASARITGSNFLSDRIRGAVIARLNASEAHQTLDETRLYSDLLSSMPLCFNLFGELHGDHARLTSAVDTLWPDLDGTPDQIRFEWSPGRRDQRYLGDRTAFDAAITLVGSNGSKGIIGIETKYHEDIKRERIPNPETRLPRYRAVTEASGIFKADWEDAILGQDLQQIWRDHLLVLSMIQASGGTAAGRYVLVHPAGNPSFSIAAQRYRSVLNDDSTFEVRTIEDLLDAHVLHTPATEAAFRSRYLW